MCGITPKREEHRCNLLDYAEHADYAGLETGINQPGLRYCNTSTTETQELKTFIKSGTCLGIDSLMPGRKEDQRKGHSWTEQR